MGKKERFTLKLGEDEKRILEEGFQNRDKLEGLKYIQSNLELFKELGFDVSFYEKLYHRIFEEFISSEEYNREYSILKYRNN